MGAVGAYRDCRPFAHLARRGGIPARRDGTRQAERRGGDSGKGTVPAPIEQHRGQASRDAPAREAHATATAGTRRGWAEGRLHRREQRAERSPHPRPLRRPVRASLRSRGRGEDIESSLSGGSVPIRRRRGGSGTPPPATVRQPRPIRASFGRPYGLPSGVHTDFLRASIRTSFGRPYGLPSGAGLFAWSPVSRRRASSPCRAKHARSGDPRGCPYGLA